MCVADGLDTELKGPAVLDLVRILTGYVAAVLVSVLVTIMPMVLLLGLAPPWGTDRPLALADVWPLIGYGVYMTGIFALPGFIVTVCLARMRCWRDWQPFALAGGVNALLALTLADATGTESISAAPDFVALCLPGGVTGAIAYWIVTGRHMAPQTGSPATDTAERRNGNSPTASHG